MAVGNVLIITLLQIVVSLVIIDRCPQEFRRRGQFYSKHGVVIFKIVISYVSMRIYVFLS